MRPSETDTGAAREGTVIRTYLGHYIVTMGGEVYTCALSTRLRKQLTYPEASPGSRRRRVQSVRKVRVVDPVAIGDRVKFEPAAGGTGMVMEILPRTNRISRSAAGGSKREQILAANVDQTVAIISAAEPEPEWGLLDRMLAIAEWREVDAAIVYNKLDLADERTASGQMRRYEAIGYTVVRTSTIDDTGKDAFRALLASKVSLLMGTSGVGKSSLINWIQPGLKLRTGEVSEATGEGRHTTTHMELVELEGGGLVGDIPGIREFGLWQIEPEDVAALFREFGAHLGSCRFRDCRHLHEPECAIKQAVEDGEVDPLRYESYVRIRSKP